MIMEEKKKTIYGYICESVSDGVLPDGFSLFKSEGNSEEIIWADGAMDGVAMYHMDLTPLNDEDHALMMDAIKAASDKQFDRADELFEELGSRVKALSAIDPMQKYIMDSKDELTAGNLFSYAVHLVKYSSDRECVKFGLSILELADIDEFETLKDIVRIIGLSDEFSLFAIFVMSRWKDGNNEIFDLARKVHGWGRIHAIDRIRPENEQIRRWLLLEGTHNDVMDSYSALPCWNNSGAGEILKNDPTKEEYTGIRDLIRGLLDESAVTGISELPDGEEILMRFLEISKDLADDIEDYEAIYEIQKYLEDQDDKDPRIIPLCFEILSCDRCKELVSQAVKHGKDIELAEELGLDYKADVFKIMQDDFNKHFYLCNILMKDPEYKEPVLELFREKLPLDSMKTKPDKILGLGMEYRNQNILEFILQELRLCPLEGIDFVETGLMSAPIRTRNDALFVLESWVSRNKKPLNELLPKLHSLLCDLREIEPDDNVRKRMDNLIEGKTAFKEISVDYDDIENSLLH